MGAWLLGATMNAVMTWWAVSLTLLSHDFGNEVLGRETLLKLVPVFVAALVCLTGHPFHGGVLRGRRAHSIWPATAMLQAAQPQPCATKPVALPVTQALPGWSHK